MLVANCDQVPGKETEKIVGLARGTAVERDVEQGVSRGPDYESFLMTESREEALSKLKRDADCLDADAVVNVTFEVSEVQNGVEVLAYGTAVKLGDEDDAEDAKETKSKKKLEN